MPRNESCGSNILGEIYHLMNPVDRHEDILYLRERNLPEGIVGGGRWSSEPQPLWGRASRNREAKAQRLVREGLQAMGLAGKGIVMPPQGG